MFVLLESSILAEPFSDPEMGWDTYYFRTRLRARSPVPGFARNASTGAFGNETTG